MTRLLATLVLAALLCGACHGATPAQQLPCDNVPIVTRATAADMAYASKEDVLLSVWTDPRGAVWAQAYDSKSLAPIWRHPVVVDGRCESNPLGAGPQAIYSEKDGCFWIVYDGIIQPNMTEREQQPAFPRVSAVFLQRLSIRDGRVLFAPVVLTERIGAPAPAPTPVVNFNPLLEWNTVLLSTIATVAANPPTASRAIAMVFVAAYDAVNSITKRAAPYYGFVDQGPSAPALTDAALASMEAAIAQACRDVLVSLWPAQTTTFDAKLGQHLAMIAAGTAKTDGIALGAASAATVIAMRSTDGFTSPAPYTPSSVDGYWRPTAPGFLPAMLPGFGNVVPWALTSAEAFRDIAPPRPGQAQYEEENREVLRFGNFTSAWRTPDQTNIALMWSAAGGTVTPPGLWMQIAAQMVLKRELPTHEACRLMALMGMAMGDAAIVSWNIKFHYNSWRPISALRFAGMDGDAATAGDAQFLSLLTTPPFPSYTSGHSTFSAAGAAVLAGYFNDDHAVFSVSSDGLTRSFTSFSGAAAEAGMSRIYGGIHFQSDNRFGQATGRRVGETVLSWLAPRERAANPDAALNADGQLVAVYAGTTVMDLGCLVWSVLVDDLKAAVERPDDSSPMPNKLFCAAGASASAITASVAADIRPTIAYSPTSDAFVATWSMGSLGAHHLGGVIAILLDSMGAPQGSAMMIAALPVTPYTGAVEPSIAYSMAADEFVIVWCGQIRGAGIMDVYGQRLVAGAAGALALAPAPSTMNQQLTNTHADVPPHRGSSPSVEATKDGYLVCWNGDGNNYQSSMPGVYCQRLDADLMLVNEPVMVTSARAGKSLDSRSQAQLSSAGNGKWAVLFTTAPSDEEEGESDDERDDRNNGRNNGNKDDSSDDNEYESSDAGVQATLLSKDLTPLPATYCVRRRPKKDDDDNTVVAITVPVVVGGVFFIAAMTYLTYELVKHCARYSAQKAAGKARRAAKAAAASA